MGTYANPTLLILALGMSLALAPSQARAQNVCDGAAAGSCDYYCTSGDSNAEVEASFNYAAPGETVCVASGTNFSGGLAVWTNLCTGSGCDKFGSPKRVTVCASSNGSSCDVKTTGDNPSDPRFSGPLNFSAGAGGFDFRNLRFSGGFDMSVKPAVHDVSFDGGEFNGQGMANPFRQPFAMPTNIEFGQPTNLLRLHDQGQVFFGMVTESVWRVWVDNIRGDSIFDHLFYISHGGYSGYTMRNVVFEYSLIENTSTGSKIKLYAPSVGTRIRFNRIYANPCPNGNTDWQISAESGSDGGQVGHDDLQIYGNYFNDDCPKTIYCGLCDGADLSARTQIYNNTFVKKIPNDEEGAVWVSSINYGQGDTVGPPRNVWFYNNTIYCPDGVNCTGSMIGIDSTTSNTFRFFNNLIMTNDSSVTVYGGNCNRFGGSSGADWDNNFYYTPADTTISTCSGGQGNSSSFSTNPGLGNPAADDFYPSASSPVAGFCNPANLDSPADAPTVYYDMPRCAEQGNCVPISRPNATNANVAIAAGAFDVGGSGQPPPPDLTPPAAPVLLE